MAVLVVHSGQCRQHAREKDGGRQAAYCAHCTGICVYIFMVCVVMAYEVMAYFDQCSGICVIVIAYIVMACIVPGY